MKTKKKIRKRHTPAFKAQIVRELFKEDQTKSQLRLKARGSSQSVARMENIALEGSRLFEHGQDMAAQATAFEAKVNELYAEIGRHTTQVAWLKKNLALNLTRSERFELVEREEAELSLTAQADLLGLSRSTLYYKTISPTPEEIAVKHRIYELGCTCGFSGQ